MSLGNWESNGLGYATVESLLEDVSHQMAMSNLSRFSRPTSTYTHKASGAMRVVKPSSASNSPRGSMSVGRRRTVMFDGPYRRRAGQHTSPPVSAGLVTNEGLQATARSNRPVSWHPSSQCPPQVSTQPYYPTASYNFDHQQFQYPPQTPEVYSTYNSPTISYGPAATSFGPYEPQYLQDQPSAYFPDSYIFDQQAHMTEQRPSQYTQQTTNSESSLYSQNDWNSFATSNFQPSATAPPTPDNFLPIQHDEPSMEPIPYQPLADDEDTGEELLGLGLYDTPKSPEADPQLDNYRSLLMNTFVGHAYRRPEPSTPCGKGLKLEEGWTPPSDDEEDEEEDAEAENEDSDEAPAAVVSHDSHKYNGNWV